MEQKQYENSHLIPMFIGTPRIKKEEDEHHSTYFWLPLYISGYHCIFLVTTVYFWLPLYISGYHCIFLATTVYFWLPLYINNITECKKD